MFTGIVQKLARVVAVENETSLRRLTLQMDELAEGVALGASVAVNGTCLTVTHVQGGSVRFDVIRETLSRTNIGRLGTGDSVNVERSFRVGDEVGGHIVSGHVAGVATLTRIEEAANERNLFFSVPAELIKYLPHKGYVALDGASLTISSVDAPACELGVCLIPETIARTTLGVAEVGYQANLEVDAQTQAIVDTVERVLSQPEWRQRMAPS